LHLNISLPVISPEVFSHLVPIPGKHWVPNSLSFTYIMAHSILSLVYMRYSIIEQIPILNNVEVFKLYKI
jgi:hypothetical protein